MLVNIHHDTRREHNRLAVAGVAFLALVLGLGWLSIALYNKTFEQVTTVTIKAERAGLQLARFGDVRVNGVLVGQVREVAQDGEEASIRVALEPEAAREIPANVEVEILPTTLFGQKFISFVLPEAPDAAPIGDGAVIPSERVETNVELSRILADLFPLLRAVRPADLNATLNALATALGGRGEQLGRTLDELDGYLATIRPHLPTLRRDLVRLADVADTYDLAAPDLVEMLANLTVTSKTIIEKERELDVFFSDLAGLATTSTRVLGANEEGLVAVGELTEPMLGLLATYSPQYPCLLRGAARYAPRLAETFEGDQVKQYVELFAAQYRSYDERDLPEYGEVGHGPWCGGLPDPPVPIPPKPLDNGTDMDEDPPTSIVPILPGLQRTGVASGYAGSEAERAIVNTVLAERTGRDPAAYGSLGSLLYGPVLRGGER